MYIEYFKAAVKHLETKGIPCPIVVGRHLSQSDIDRISDVFKMSIPEGLLQYWKEVGDGFSLQWNESEAQELEGLVSAGLSFVEDILAEHRWMQEQNLQKVHSQDPRISTEAARRLRWIPIYGIGEGGIVLCLDTGTNPPAVRYYESYWPDHAAVWNSTIAASLPEFIKNWSRYCFSGGSMTNRGYDLEGTFDWHPSHFNKKYDRGTDLPDE